MFQTKILEKIKAHVLCLFFYRKSCSYWDNVENIVQQDRVYTTMQQGACAFRAG